MVRKYHQNRKDRRHESEGMKKYEEERKNRGLDSRFMGMLSEDHSAPANLPQEVVHKYYPKCEYMDRYELDDTIEGVDENIDETVRKVEGNHSESMW